MSRRNLPLSMKIKVKQSGSKEGKALIQSLKKRFDPELIDLIHRYLDTQDDQLYIPFFIYYQDFVANNHEVQSISRIPLEKTESHQGQTPRGSYKQP
jgi:hypothetical protein